MVRCALPWGAGLVGGKDGADGLAFVCGKLVAEGRGIDDLLALVRRHLAEIDDGARHEPASRSGNPIELLDGVIPLLLLLRAKALQALYTVEHPAALLRVHGVEVAQGIELVLLHLRRQFAEARLILEGTLLFCEREILVVVHPLLEMLLPRRGSGRGRCDGMVGFSGLRANLWPGLHGGRRRCPSHLGWRGGFLAAGARVRRHSDKQHSKCCAGTMPEWRRQLHNG
jgi:hypothetical protein